MWRYLGTIVSSVFVGNSIRSVNSVSHLFLTLAFASAIMLFLTFRLQDIAKDDTNLS